MYGFLNKTVFVEVTVEHPVTGIVGVHYVEVSASLTHKEANAANQEIEKGYKVLSARVWGTKG